MKPSFCWKDPDKESEEYNYMPVETTEKGSASLNWLTVSRRKQNWQLLSVNVAVHSPKPPLDNENKDYRPNWYCMVGQYDKRTNCGHTWSFKSRFSLVWWTVPLTEKAESNKSFSRFRGKIKSTVFYHWEFWCIELHWLCIFHCQYFLLNWDTFTFLCRVNPTLRCT